MRRVRHESIAFGGPELLRRFLVGMEWYMIHSLRIIFMSGRGWAMMQRDSLGWWNGPQVLWWPSPIYEVSISTPFSFFRSFFPSFFLALSTVSQLIVLHGPSLFRAQQSWPYFLLFFHAFMLACFLPFPLRWLLLPVLLSTVWFSVGLVGLEFGWNGFEIGDESINVISRTWKNNKC